MKESALQRPYQPDRWSWLVLMGAVVLFTGCGGSPPPAASSSPNTDLQPSTAQPLLSANPPAVMRVGYDERPLEAVTFPERSEQELAAAALGRIGKSAVPQLVQALRHRDPKIRTQAAQVLAKIGPDAASAVPYLTAALDDDQPSVRRAASRALGEIGPASETAVPALMRSLMQPPSPQGER